MSTKIQVRRGLKADLPQLSTGEIGLCTDTEQLYIGTGGKNLEVLSTNSPAMSFKNKIINGNFDVWQRGTSFDLADMKVYGLASTVGSNYVADRWDFFMSGTTSSTNPTGTLTKIITDLNGVPINETQINITNVGEVIQIYYLQRIESVHTLAGKPVTVSFYADGDNNQEIDLHVNQFFGVGGTPSPSVVQRTGKIILTPITQKYTYTFFLPSTAGKTIGTAGNNSLNLAFVLKDTSLSDSPNFKTGTINIYQVQLEEGEVATEFEQRPIAIEELLCKRYYETIGLNGAVLMGRNSNMAAINLQYYPKRTNPSLVHIAPLRLFFNTREGNDSTIRDIGYPLFIVGIGSMENKATLLGLFGASLITAEQKENILFAMAKPIVIADCIIALDAEIY